MPSEVQTAERLAIGFHDPRAIMGTPEQPMTMQQRRAEGWDWLDRQWELWPRPDLKRAMLVPPIFRRFKPRSN